MHPLTTDVLADSGAPAPFLLSGVIAYADPGQCQVLDMRGGVHRFTFTEQTVFVGGLDPATLTGQRVDLTVDTLMQVTCVNKHAPAAT